MKEGVKPAGHRGGATGALADRSLPHRAALQGTRRKVERLPDVFSASRQGGRGLKAQGPLCGSENGPCTPAKLLATTPVPVKVGFHLKRTYSQQ